MNSWDNLSMAQRAEVIKLAVQNGIHDLDTIRGAYNEYAVGGSIHIDPSKKGTFTAAAKKHGMGVQEFASRVLANKEDYSPAMVKKANFARNASKWHGYGGHIYDGTTEDTQQMNIPYAGELPDVTVIPRRIANKAWDKVQERWVGDMPTYYAVNPETGKEEMLREIGNGKYSTYDDKYVFDVLGAEAAKKEREQWIRNGGNASDFDKVMLGTLGLGLAPIALPEAATGIWAASQTPAGQTLLAGTLGDEAWEALNHGVTGQSWGDNLGDVIGLDKDNYLGRTALGLANPFYFASPSMVYKGGESVLGVGKEVGKAINKGLDVFNSPLTGKWTTVGNKQYRLSPNSLGANGSFIEQRIPQITAENAASMTPEQWTVAQDAAIARGDMAEAQRLRDLHFKVSAPNTQIIDKNGNPIHSYHGTGKRFNEFDTTGKYSTLDEGYYGKGAYFAPNKELAQMYADIERTPIMYDTYLNIKNPLRHVRDENADLYGKAIVDNDGVISTLPDDLVDETFDMTEYVATKPTQIKLADTVTYDDKGIRIPLGERDNFNINDMRYGLLPFGIGLTGYGLYNSGK